MDKDDDVDTALDETGKSRMKQEEKRPSLKVWVS